MNPTALFKIRGLMARFQADHPKVVSYFATVFGTEGLPEGSVIEISVKKPGEDEVVTNMRVTANDVEMIQAIKELR